MPGQETEQSLSTINHNGHLVGMVTREMQRARNHQRTVTEEVAWSSRRRFHDVPVQLMTVECAGLATNQGLVRAPAGATVKGLFVRAVYLQAVPMDRL
jgi:hypothetical protein